MSNKHLSKFAISCFALGALFVVAGCELAPVYLGGSKDAVTTTVSGLAQKLGAISFDTPENRAEQIIYADLSFRLHGSIPEQVKLYALNVVVTATTIEVTQLETTNPEKAYRSTLTAVFTLTDSSDDTELLRDSRFSAAQFSRSSQLTANTKAAEKAEEQASLELSNMIRARLTAYFNTEI